MSTVAELQEKKDAIAEDIRKMAKEFNGSPEGWKSTSQKAKFEKLNADYNSVIEGIEDAGSVTRAVKQIDDYDRQPGNNPHGIGRSQNGPVRHTGVFDRDPDSEYAHRGGKEPAEFLKGADGKSVPLLSREQSFATATHNPSSEFGDHANLDAGDYFRAVFNGPKTIAERNALQEGTNSQGGYTVPHLLSSQLIDLMRAKSRTVQAGAKTIPLDTERTSFAKLLSDPEPGWRDELAPVNESEPTFGLVTFQAKSLGVMCRVSQEVLDDSVNIGRELPRIIAGALAQEVDRVALAGTGTDPEPRGLLSTAGIATIASSDPVGNAPTDFVPFLNAVETLETANIDGPFSAIMHPRTKSLYDGLTDSTGQPLRRPASVEGLSLYSTTKMPTDEAVASDNDGSSIVVGNYGDLILGMRHNIRMMTLNELFRGTNEVGFFAALRMDVQVWRESSFVRITGNRKAA